MLLTSLHLTSLKVGSGKLMKKSGRNF